MWFSYGTPSSEQGAKADTWVSNAGYNKCKDWKERKGRWKLTFIGSRQFLKLVCFEQSKRSRGQFVPRKSFFFLNVKLWMVHLKNLVCLGSILVYLIENPRSHWRTSNPSSDPRRRDITVSSSSIECGEASTSPRKTRRTYYSGRLPIF